MEAETAALMRKEAQESLEQNFTPSLARRLSRQFIEQTRQSVPRSPSSARDSNRYYQSPTRDLAAEPSLVGPSDVHAKQSEYRSGAVDHRGIRRTNSLLEPCKYDNLRRHSPRTSISLFDDNDCDDRLLPPLPRHIMTLGRRFKESVGTNARRDSFYGYRTDKIQEEPGDDVSTSYLSACKEDAANVAENDRSVSEGTSTSVCNSNANSMDNTTITTSSVSARSHEVSPTESSSNLGESSYSKSSCCKSDISKSFENRLLAAENLIKESKLKNLQQFNPNLSCNYKDTDKCDKETLRTTSDPLSSGSNSKRRSCIPSLRLRSDSLSRDSSVSVDRGKSLDSSDASGVNQERSILSKLFRGTGTATGKQDDPKDSNRSQKPKHRISRFLRPDFFDTPREESQYVKEKEAQKAAENERRKSRFMRRKSESKERKEDGGSRDEKICKELKNEMNALQKDKLDSVVSFEDKSNKENKESKPKVEQGSSKSSFLHSLEKKLERLRSNDEMTTTTTTTVTTKPTMNGSARERGLRECSAPPVECPSTDSSLPEVKRTLSEEDLSRRGGSSNVDPKGVPSKGRVTSVLGLFKTSADTSKRNANGGSRTQNAIVSKLKRSPPKCVKPAEPSFEEDAIATSKIPTTKFVRADNKLTKKLQENKKSPEKVMGEFKRSPPKEKTKEKESIAAKERKPFAEKQLGRELKRAPEKAAPSSDSSASSSDKIKLDKVDSPRRKSSDQLESPLRKVVEDGHVQESVVSSEDKKVIKTKRNISSLIGRNEPAKVDRGEDVDKRIKKLVKSKEDAGCGKDEIDSSRKKRIVRVVRKVVKKSSDSSEGKSDEKGKSAKPLTKKETKGEKVEKNSEGSNVTATRGKEGLIEGNDNDQTGAKSSSSGSKRAKSTDLLAKPREHAAENTNTNPMLTTDNSKETRNGAAASAKFDVNALSVSQKSCPSSQSVSSALPTERDTSSPATLNDSRFTVCQSEQCTRPSRANLKLDLTKIPQHAFRHATPKRDLGSPRSDSPKANPAAAPSIESPKTTDKLMEGLSRMTHHANITGNKIIIDKPLRAKDVAELKREVTECARIIENHVESRDVSSSQLRLASETSEPTEIVRQDESREIKPSPSQGIDDLSHGGAGTRELPDDCIIGDMVSPEEPESFDSWSICSADLNHNRGDLHSPTSPSYALFLRGDSSESVIDRIRRRSFYSRFNDRKRPSLTAPPPGVSSVTLPRRFSFNSSRERERDRLYNYGVPRTR